MSDQEPDGNLRREPAEIECSSCGTTFEHVKKGALPKRCPECRETKMPGHTPAGENAPNRGRSIEKLESNLRVQLAGLSMLAALADPWLGQHCAKHVEQAAKVHANLAATNPKLRAAMEKGVELAGWGPVIIFWLTFAVPAIAHYRAAKTAPAAPENVAYPKFGATRDAI